LSSQSMQSAQQSQLNSSQFMDLKSPEVGRLFTGSPIVRPISQNSLRSSVSTLSGKNTLLQNYVPANAAVFLQGDVLSLILSWLSPRDVLRDSLVAKSWKKATEHPLVWKNLSLRYFPKPIRHLQSTSQESTTALTDWKGLFVKLFTTRFVEFPPDKTKGLMSSLKIGYQVHCSSILQGHVSFFVSKDTNHVWTKSVPNSWFALDLGEGRKMFPTHYTMKYASSGSLCCPRNWRLEGTNDLNALLSAKNGNEESQKWTPLSVHANDKTLDVDYQEHTWSIQNAPQSFRIFRIVQTGPNKFPERNHDPHLITTWSNVLVVSGFDLFGVFQEKIRKQKSDIIAEGIVSQIGTSNVKVTASSIAKGSPRDFIQKKKLSLWTKNFSGSWFCVDLGKHRAAKIVSYCLRYSSSGNHCCPRNWNLEARNSSKDNWEVLKSHVHDMSLDNAYEVHHWNVTTNKFFRYYRIVQAGPNKYMARDDTWSNVLVCSGFELYGDLQDQTPRSLIRKISDFIEKRNSRETGAGPSSPPKNS